MNTATSFIAVITRKIPYCMRKLSKNYSYSWQEFFIIAVITRKIPHCMRKLSKNYSYSWQEFFIIH